MARLAESSFAPRKLIKPLPGGRAHPRESRQRRRYKKIFGASWLAQNLASLSALRFFSSGVIAFYAADASAKMLEPRCLQAM
jgi:hypothetical protein